MIACVLSQIVDFLDIIIQLEDLMGLLVLMVSLVVNQWDP